MSSNLTKIMIRPPEEIKTRLRVYAALQGKPMATVCNEIIVGWVDANTPTLAEVTK